MIWLPTILLLLACMLLSGSFSGSETALFSLTADELEQMSQGSTTERNIWRLLQNPQALLVSILFGNLLVNVLFFSVAATLAGSIHQSPAVAGAVNVGCFLTLLVFGEVVPKSIAINSPRPIAKLAVFPLSLLVVVLKPVRIVLETLTESLTRPMFRRLTAPHITQEDLKLLIEMIAHHGELSVSENTFMRRVFELKALKVREVMVPRVDLPHFDIEADRDGFLELLSEARERSVIAYRRDPEDVVGIIRAKAVLLQGLNPSQAVRKVLFVPELKKVDSLLRQFRDEKLSLALVVDEYGTLAGLISLEIILEWIVGDIADEFEEELPKVRTEADGRWVLRGDLPVRSWRELIGIDFDEAPEIDTLGGLVAHLAGKIPETGDKVRHGDLHFTVRSVRKGRILEVSLEPLEKEA